MRTHLVGGTTLATGLVLSLVLVLAAGCETSSDGAPQPGADRGTAAPIAERGRMFPRPVPRPAFDVATAAPAPAPAPATSPASAFPSPASPVPPRPAIGVPSTHTVSAGENIYDVARTYEVDAYALAVTNELRPPFELSEGQVLIIPGAGTSGAGTPASSPSAAVAATSESQAVPEAQSAGEPTPFGRPPERPASAASTERAARSSDRSGDKETASLSPDQADSAAGPSREGFVWPVSGRIVSSYGPKGGGRYNDGINIAAPEGTTVRAAESGVVAYAGNELRGFGRTLLIKHPGGWVTAYAHNSELLVQRGQQVRRGQAVAKVGATGGVDEPQLHFEVRRSRKAIDPVTLLPRSGASARHGSTEG